MQVVCRTCGEPFLAYEHKGDNLKKRRRDKEAVSAEVKDKGGACIKYVLVYSYTFNIIILLHTNLLLLGVQQHNGSCWVKVN